VAIGAVIAAGAWYLFFWPSSNQTWHWTFYFCNIYIYCGFMNHVHPCSSNFSMIMIPNGGIPLPCFIAGQKWVFVDWLWWVVVRSHIGLRGGRNSSRSPPRRRDSRSPPRSG
jgi:hypothetical protein